MKNAIKLFNDKKIRTLWNDDEEKWYFSIVDVVAVLTENDYQGARNYWKVLKHRLNEEGNESVTNCNQLKLQSSDGKYYLTDVADTEQLLRLIQSIPSKKAEPFKQWLAHVGYDRVQEIENPELAQNRVKEYYELKGYPKEWIDKRLRGTAVRQELTEEWQIRGIKEKKDFAILTNEIHKATFDIPINKHKEIKNIPKKSKINLREHMTDLELIFTMLGEKATTEITQTKNAKGFNELKKASKKGENIAKSARKELEKETGKSIISLKNAKEIHFKNKKYLK